MDAAAKSLRDIFISHSSRDKAEFIEPLVASLEAAGLQCWYDTLEMLPGDSLVEKLNHGLTHCKVILLCLSANFLSGKWSQKELRAATSLQEHAAGPIRVVPLMIGDPEVILREVPLPLGDMLYLKWSDGAEAITSRLRQAVLAVDNAGERYWSTAGRDAYHKGNYAQAALYSGKAIEHNHKLIEAHVIYYAALLRLGDANIEHVLLRVFNNRSLWHDIEPKAPEGLDLDAYDFTRDYLSQRVSGEEIDSHEYADAVGDYLSFPVDGKKAWQYLQRLWDRSGFASLRSNIVSAALFLGRADAWSWVREVYRTSDDEDVRKGIATTCSVIAFRDPSMRQAMAAAAEEMLSDTSKNVRETALVAAYFHSPNGSQLAVAALDDPNHGVRELAVNLLSGYVSLIPDGAFSVKKGPPRPADSLLTPQLVRKALYDREAAVFESMLEAIREGRVSLPDDLDLGQLPKDEVLGANNPQVRVLGCIGTDDAYTRILTFAQDDPDEGTRKAACEILAESSFVPPAPALRQLVMQESSDDVLEHLHKLVVRTATRQDVDLLDRVINWAVERDERHLLTDALWRLVRLGAVESARRAVACCLAGEKFASLIPHLKNLVNLGCEAEATTVVRWCLREDSDLSQAVLAAGLLPGVELAAIEPYCNNESPEVVAAALRAREKRCADGIALGRVQDLYSAWIEKLATRDWDAVWGLLGVVDAKLEFIGKEEGLEALTIIYDELNKDPKGSWPLRATWERLRLLGKPIHHHRYSGSEGVPHGWPDETGPFYGIRGV